MHSARLARVSNFEDLAHAVSVVCSPPVLGCATILVAGMRGVGYPTTWPNVVLLLAFLALVPTLFTYLFYRTGHSRSLDLTVRSERIVPSWFAVGCSLLALAGLYLQGAPWALVVTSAALASQLIILAVLTMRVKVSYHAASVAALASVARLVLSPEIAVSMILLVLGVGWARLFLGRHTVAEVAIGLATPSPLFLTWVG